MSGHDITAPFQNRLAINHYAPHLGGFFSKEKVMDLSRMKRIVGQCQETGELTKLERHISKRISVLANRAHKAGVDRQWEIIKNAKVGDTLYVTTAGAFVGGDIQRGDALKVSYVQPRAKRIWFYGENGKANDMYMNASQAMRYLLRFEPPEKPMSETERNMHKRIGENLARIGEFS